MKVGVGGLIIFMEKLDRRLARHVHPNCQYISKLNAGTPILGEITTE